MFWSQLMPIVSFISNARPQPAPVAGDAACASVGFGYWYWFSTGVPGAQV